MAETPNYKWSKPDVGGSSGVWGTMLNTIIDQIDAVVKAVSDAAAAALPKAGGTMSGRADLKTATMAIVNKGNVSGPVELDLAEAQYFTATLTGATQFSFKNTPAGSTATGVILRLTNAGGKAITWPTGTKWPAGVAPTLTAAGVDLIGFLTDDAGATWRAVVSGKDVR